MKRIGISIFFVCQFYACNRDSDNINDTPPPQLNQRSIEVALNLSTGYTVNQATGKQVQPVINSKGLHITTGRPVPVSESQGIDDVVEIRELIINPQVIGEKSVYPSFPNSGLRSGKSAKSKLETNAIDSAADFILTNSTGDTIETNRPQQIRGKFLPCIHPKPTIVQSPRFNANAISDIQSLDEFQGLSSSHILTLLQDHVGNIWIGTYGGGVSRYDGHTLTTYTEEEGLPNNRVWAIMEDRQGNLWFGTGGGGLAKFDGHNFTHFSEREGLADNNVTTIIQDRYDNIWFNSGSSGVNKFDGKAITHYSTREGMTSNTTSCIFEDREGNIWFGTTAGLCKFDGRHFSQFTENEGLANNTVRSIVQDAEGDLWIGTKSGISRFDGDFFTNYLMEDGLGFNNVGALLLDDQQGLWIGTLGGGVCRFFDNTFTFFTTAEGLSDNRVISLLQDETGNIWMGTRGGGLNRYNGRSFTYNSSRNILFRTNVMAILLEKTGAYWYGTNGSGLFQSNQGKILQYTTEGGLPSDNITALLEDHLGQIWVGMDAGKLCMFSAGKCYYFPTDHQIPKYNIWTLAEDRHGRIWIGTDGGGIVLLEPEENMSRSYEMTFFNDQNGLSNNRIRSIIEDHRGQIWIATGGGGISKFDDRSFTHYTEREGLSSNVIWSLFESTDGKILIGTNGAGLTFFDTNPQDGKNALMHFKMEQGLSSNRIRSVIEDYKGNIWVGTTTGLNQIIVESNSSTIASEEQSVLVYSYANSDGLKAINFNRNCVLIDDHLQAWWGSGNHLVELDLSLHNVNKVRPTIVLNQLLIGDSYYNYRTSISTPNNGFLFDSIQPFTNIPSGLVLNHDHNHVTFQFAAKDWQAPQKLKYSYKLMGLDEQWSNPTTDTKVDYRNMPPGKYTFRVASIGQGSIWSEYLDFPFTINPPWWNTWWARSLLSLVLISMIYLYVRIRTANLKTRQKELEKLVTQRTAEVVRQKDELARKNMIINLEKEKSEELLLNILPADIAEELKSSGSSPARAFEEVTVLFTDFKGFTKISEKMAPAELVKEINVCFKAFDEIVDEYQIEKIKTIGDSYMAAGGLRLQDSSKVHDVINVALEMQQFMATFNDHRRRAAQPALEMRCGIHTGPVVAGIVGIKKFQYDIWGDTVNLASSMESSGAIGKVNISQTTYDLIKDNPNYCCVSRGKLQAKNKGLIHMYFVDKV